MRHVRDLTLISSGGGPTTLSQTLSLAEARRIALAAQLFVPAVAAPKGAAALGKIVRRLGAVQIDSVNVLVRSHYLPLYSRCGSYRAGAARARGVRRQPLAVRVLGPRSFVPARRALSAVPLAHGTGAQRRGHVETAASLRDLAQDAGDRGAGADSRARRARRERARRLRQIERQLVGLEPGQGDPGVAVLDRRRHDRAAPEFRAPVRSHRARAAGACSDRERAAAGAGAA